MTFVLGSCKGQRDVSSHRSLVETDSTINPLPTQRARSELVILRDAVGRYRSQFGESPRRLHDLERLDGAVFSYERFEKWSRDPWGHEYRLVPGKGAVDIYSAGPDGAFGTPDDVR